MTTSTAHDPLTGAWNRRQLFAELSEAISHRRSLALALIDLDHFKHFNMHNGYSVGDEVLRAVPRVLERRLHPGDAIYRHAGEQFVVLMPDRDRRGAAAQAEQLRAEIERTLTPPQLEHCGDPHCLGPVRAVTASIGVVLLGSPATVEATLTLALDTMFRAKSEGRNRVCIAGSLDDIRV